MESTFKHLSNVKDSNSNWMAHIIVDILVLKEIPDLLSSIKTNFSDNSLKSNNKSISIVCISKALSEEIKLVLKYFSILLVHHHVAMDTWVNKILKSLFPALTQRQLTLMVPNYVLVSTTRIPNQTKPNS